MKNIFWFLITLPISWNIILILFICRLYLSIFPFFCILMKWVIFYLYSYVIKAKKKFVTNQSFVFGGIISIIALFMMLSGELSYIWPPSTPIVEIWSIFFLFWTPSLELWPLFCARKVFTKSANRVQVYKVTIPPDLFQLLKKYEILAMDVEEAKWNKYLVISPLRSKLTMYSIKDKI